MAQRPPRMPRRQTPEPGQPEVPEVPQIPQVTRPEPQDYQAEPPTDALNIVQAQNLERKLPTAKPNPTPARPKQATPKPVDAASGRRAKPGEPVAGVPLPSSRTKADGTAAKRPLVERAKEKQNERRREDRAKFSMAVRRKPGEIPDQQQPATDGVPVAAHRFSGRIAALIVVFAFFAVMLVPTVNYYRTQVGEIAELRASIAAMEAKRDELKTEIARWDDPLYIKQQARERINLVMPGEKLYMVVGEDSAADDESTTGNGSTYEVRQELPWVDALVDSVNRSATD